MGEKVSFREKLAYGVGDGGCNFVWTTISSFLVLYYTDSVGLSAAVVGTIMLITRILDAFTDIGMGAIIDRTHTKWGKARPWVLWSSLPMAIGLILLFNVPGNLGTSGKTIYTFLTYLFITSIAYTASNLSYNSLLSLITTEQNDRTTMSSIRFICTLIAILFISFTTMKFVAKFGWGGTSVIYGIIAFVLLLITFFGTKERYVPIVTKEHSHITFGQSVKILFQNKYFIFAALLFVVNYAAIGVTGGIGIYYARDVLGNADFFGTLTLAGMFPILIGLPIFPALAKKYGKWVCLMAGYILQIIGLVIIIAMPTNLTAVLAGLVIKGVGSVPHTAGLFALVADVVDYGEWKTNVRIDGLTYSATSFGMKVGTGIGTAMVGWILAFGKYDAAASAQGDNALRAMKALYAYIPLTLVILGVMVLSFLNIDKIYPIITKDLEKRRAKACE